VKVFYIILVRWRVYPYSLARRIIDDLTENFPAPEHVEIREVEEVEG
jgi:hypothetical protein